LYKWRKLSGLSSIPSGHVILLLIVSIEFCCCWAQLLANDSIANNPVTRPNRTMVTTRQRDTTILPHIEANISIRSMRSANRNFNRIEKINQNIFLLNTLTSWETLTSVSLSMSLTSSFSFLLNHWRERNKL
jgi:hypothetical protein